MNYTNNVKIQHTVNIFAKKEVHINFKYFLLLNSLSALFTVYRHDTDSQSTVSFDFVIKLFLSNIQFQIYQKHVNLKHLKCFASKIKIYLF